MEIFNYANDCRQSASLSNVQNQRIGRDSFTIGMQRIGYTMAADEQMDDAGGVALDVEAISAKYRGIAKIKRLQHIATHSKADQKRAVELSIDAIKADTCDTDAYKLLHQTYASVLGPGYSYDGTWVERTELRAATRRAAIEKDLQMQMSNQIRENLRVRARTRAAFTSAHMCA